MSTARAVALEALVRFERGAVHLRDTLESSYRRHPELAARDKAFCRELVYSTVQRLNTLDWALGRFAARGTEQVAPEVRAALRLGACQILYMADRVPVYAAVNESVDLAKRRAPRAASFVNGVLRSLERNRAALPWPDERADPVAALALRTSHPEWLVRRWLERFGPDECAALLEKDNQLPAMCVRINALKGDRESLRRLLAEEGVTAEPTALSPDGLRLSSYPSLGELKSFREGRFMVQDESSQLVARLMAPLPGETVFDLCAAPGGKSTHMAELMGDKGKILACDVHAKRLLMLQQNCRRLGVHIVEPVKLDGRAAAHKHAGEADRVLVDAPCSGLGVLRRRPDIRWNKDLESVVGTFPPIQAELIDAAAHAVKPGGVLVYSTCTTEPEENEQVVDKFLSKHTDFKTDPGGLPQDAVTPQGWLRLLPQRHDTDGFFAARLRRGA